MKGLNLRAYVFICLGLMAAVPALILGGAQTRWWAAIQVEQVDYQNRLAAQALAREIGLLVDAHARAVEALAQQVEAEGSMDPVTLQRMVERQRAAFDTFPLMYVADAAGVALAGDPAVDTTGSPTAGKNFSDRDYYQKLIATGQTSISRVQVGRTIAVPTIQIVAPVRDSAGTLIGFSEGSLDLGRIQAQAEEITGRRLGRDTTVLDAEGRAIAYAGTAVGEVMRNLSGFALYQPAAATDGELRQDVDEGGEPVRAVAAPITIRGLNWTVVVARPEALNQAQVAEAERQTLTVAGVALSMGLLLAAGLSWVLARPIAGLAAVATAVGRGDFSRSPARPRAWHPREVGALLSAVGQMIAQLRARTEDLEQRVEERTAALQAANQELDASLGRLQRARDESEAAQQRYASLFEQNPDAVFSLDLRLHMSSANPACERLTGYAFDDLIHSSLTPLVLAEDRQLLSKQLALVMEGEPRDFETALVHKDGHPVPVHITALPVVIGGEIVGIYGIAKDVTARKRAEEALEYQALHDSLTSLPNRTLLHERLERGILASQRDGRGLALMIMDLDHFKDVNDTLGHQSGDELLQQVAARLREVLRTSDTVARLGGDEFAILLPGIGATAATQVAQKLLRALEPYFSIGEQQLDVGASIGIATCPDDGEDTATLLRRADLAMYAAKRDKSGFAVYAPEQDQDSADRLLLVGELRRAIENDELCLHYQPKVSFKTGRVIRVEALVRWQHPEHGLVPPNKFIPLAEQTGLIRPLSQWVLNSALAQCQAWRAKGLPIPVAVNLSMHNLQDPQLPMQIAGLLARWGVAPSDLIVEVTETSLMADPGRTRDVLTRLRGMGIQIAIDDFGTGHSAISYLKHLPVNEIKIDRSFVRDMLQNESDAAIVRSTIDLGHSLSMEVVAEGIEDEETWNQLAGLGCDIAQGYFLSRPLPADELSGWLQQSAWGLREADRPDAPAPAAPIDDTLAA